MCCFARCWCEVLLKNKVTIAKSEAYYLASLLLCLSSYNSLLRMKLITIYENTH